MVIKGEYNTYFDKEILTDGMKAVQLDEDKHIDRQISSNYKQCYDYQSLGFSAK